MTQAQPRTLDVTVDYEEAPTPNSEIGRRIAREGAALVARAGSAERKDLLKAFAIGHSDLVNINPYLIKIKAGWNSRDFDNPDNLAHIDTLARSISEIGVQQPLTVVAENDSLFVTDGHCRLLATLRAIDFYGAEIKSVPVRAESRFATEADRVMGQIVRNSGKNLSPLEAGAVFVKLTAFGWSVKQIADKAGITVAYVIRILDLMAGASPAIMEMVNTGKVAANMAAQVLRDNDNDVEVAEEMLVDAVVIAETEGKARATARHVLAAAEGSGKTKPRASKIHALREIFEARTTGVENKNAETVTITVSAENWNAISRVLGIDQNQ